MKIACIGGVKHGKVKDVLNGINKNELDWEFKADLPPQPGLVVQVFVISLGLSLKFRWVTSLQRIRRSVTSSFPLLMKLLSIGD